MVSFSRSLNGGQPEERFYLASIPPIASRKRKIHLVDDIVDSIEIEFIASVQDPTPAEVIKFLELQLNKVASQQDLRRHLTSDFKAEKLTECSLAKLFTVSPYDTESISLRQSQHMVRDRTIARHVLPDKESQEVSGLRKYDALVSLLDIYVFSERPYTPSKSLGRGAAGHATHVLDRSAGATAQAQVTRGRGLVHSCCIALVITCASNRSTQTCLPAVHRVFMSCPTCGSDTAFLSH